MSKCDMMLRGKFFFLKAEDGIRDSSGTGVQTCALPISAGSDYTAGTGTLNFAAGVTTRTITVPITDDLIDEADETFTVNLANPSSATIADGTGLGTDRKSVASGKRADLGGRRILKKKTG